MFRKPIQSLVVLFCLSLSLFLSTASFAEPVRVFVSIIPQKTFVEKVGGNQVIVEAMVKAGGNPALYQPTPQQMQRLSQADIYITSGVPFESVWMEAIISANPEMSVVDGLQGLELRALQEHHHGEAQEMKEEDHQESNLDPHVWTSPVLVQYMLKTIRDALIAIDGANKEIYEYGYTMYKDKIDKLDSDIGVSLQAINHNKFMTFHPTWGYFAATYGLTQIVVEQQGKEPGTQSLQRLIEEAREEKIKVIFVQPQFSKKLARVIAQAVKAEIIEVDALAADYDENMRALAKHLKQALTQ